MGDVELEVSLVSGVVREGVGRGVRFVVEFQLCSAREDCYRVTHDISGLGVDGGEIDRGSLTVMKVAEIV
jgi:hypothetical protein